MAAIPSPWINEGELLLHIGVNKTGTSALQGALALARPRLLEQGVCYPGRDANHLNAMKSLLQKRRGWENGGVVPPATLWESVAEEMRAPEARRLMISAEYLCGLRRRSARQVVRELGRYRVRAMITLRPLEQLLPSQWQQGVKGRWSEPYEEWLEKVCEGPTAKHRSTRQFWWRNDHAALVERWARMVGRKRVAVVIVDTANRNMIFETVEDLLGVTRGTVVADPDTRTNRSLSAEEAEMLRALNQSMPSTVDYQFHRFVLRRHGIERIVEGRRPGELEHPLRVPREVAERMRQIGADHVARIRELGVPVIGDLDALVPSTPVDDTPIDRPRMVPIDVATMMLSGVIEGSSTLVARRDEEIARLQSARRRRAGTTVSTGTSARPSPSPSPLLTRALRRLRRRAGRVRRSIRSRRAR